MIDGRGTWPAGLEHVALADRMRCNYLELLATPEHVVQDYRDVMSAEAEAVEIRNRWGNR